MKIDLRFVEVGYELMIASEYVKLLEANLPRIHEAEKKRVWVDLDPDDEADRSVAHHLQDRLDEGVTTRFLTAAAIVATWAIYESTVQKMADHIRHAKEIGLKMSHLRGSFLQRARRYFDDVLKFDLHPVTTDWPRLEHVADLRHVLAHANGRLWDVPVDDLRRVELWLKSTAGVSVVDDEYVVVSLGFARETHDFIEALLRDLVDRVRNAF